jgi:hypothetical protein
MKVKREANLAVSWDIWGISGVKQKDKQHRRCAAYGADEPRYVCGICAFQVLHA